MIRPLKPRPKTILKIGAALALVALILFIWANMRSVPVRVQITFIGFTNRDDITYTTTNGTFPITLAYFHVSNAGKWSVVDRGVYGYEIKNKPFAAEDSWGEPLSISELKPGEFETMSVIAPTNNTAPWRLWLSFSKVDWRSRLYQKPPTVLRTIVDFIPEKWLRPRGYAISSDWINGPVATNTFTNKPSLP